MPSGMTMVELLVVIAIIGLLIALLLPAVQQTRESARRTQCGNNLRQMGIGLLDYCNANNTLPVGCIDCPVADPKVNRRLAWSLFLLPFIEESVAWSTYDQTAAYYSAANRQATSVVIPIYLCPSTIRLTRARTGNTTGDVNGNGRYDPGDFMAMIDYGGMYRFGQFPGRQQRSPGLRQTRPPPPNHRRNLPHHPGRRRFRPRNDHGWRMGRRREHLLGRRADQLAARQRSLERSSRRRSGLFCDGSVQFLAEEMSVPLLEALCTRAGGEVMEPPP